MRDKPLFAEAIAVGDDGPFVPGLVEGPPAELGAAEFGTMIYVVGRYGDHTPDVVATPGPGEVSREWMREHFREGDMPEPGAIEAWIVASRKRFRAWTAEQAVTS